MNSIDYTTVSHEQCRLHHTESHLFHINRVDCVQLHHMHTADCTPIAYSEVTNV